MPYVRDLIRNIKGRTLPTVNEEQSILFALKKLKSLNKGALIVINSEYLLGVFSERDYAKSLILEKTVNLDTAIKYVMSKNVIFVEPDYTLDECIKLMSRRGIRHLPVIENGKLLEMISIMDVIDYIVDDRDFFIDQLLRYITGSQTNYKGSEYSYTPYSNFDEREKASTSPIPIF